MSTARPTSRDAAYFTRIYETNPDPWNFTDSAYEREKYQITLRALNGRHFANALEVGCSIGVFTRLLAPFCTSLLSVDIADKALQSAAERCADLPQVAFQNMNILQEWPAEKFDLIVISEVLYFLVAEDIRKIASLSNQTLLPSGLILLINYTETIDEPCSGNQAADIFMQSSMLTTAQHSRHEKFRLDLLRA